MARDVALRHTVSDALVAELRHQPTEQGRGIVPPNGSQLDVAPRASSLMNEARSTRDKGATSRMRRAAFEAGCPVGSGKPVDDADGRHRAVALRTNDRTVCTRHLAPFSEGAA